jgi:hypothetical protein
MDYEKFASTLNKFKIEVSFTKRTSSISGVVDNICACFTYNDSIDKTLHLEPSLIASVSNSLDKNNKLNSWLIFSNDKVDPVVYKEILSFALLKDSQKVMKLKDCLDKK